MKRGVTYVTYLLVCTCLAACSREEGDMPSAEADEIVFSAKVAQAAAAPTRAESTMAEEYTPVDDTFGTIYIHHTQNERYSHGKYSDMTEDDASYTSSGGILQQQTPDSGCWYWGGPDKQHLFHAWNLPHDGEKQTDTGEHQSLVTLNVDNNRLGTVNLSMDKSYEYTVTDGNMVESTYHRLSNLEYFIGAVCGPLDLQTNGSNIAVLQFKHLVAKIIIERIQYFSPGGGVEEVSEQIEFSMPNMPNHAYWTTGVPASDPSYDFNAAKEEPHLLPLKNEGTGFEYTLNQETDYGVKGRLQNKSCFYIYPCQFDDKNPFDSKLGEIEFRYNGSCYYGTLESITTVRGLDAGECISLILRLKDGNVSGLYPHINEWGSSDKVATDHDKPGIYSVDDWRRFADYLREYMNGGSPEPPAGLFDEDDNVNLYCNLDLTSMPNYTDTELLDYLATNEKKISGNGHRLKSDTQWNKEKYENVLDDLWVTANGEDIEFE